MFSALNPSKCTHTWSSGQPMLQRPGSSWQFGALLKGLTSVVVRAAGDEIRSGVQTLALRFLSLCACAVSSSLDCAFPVHVCFVVLHAVRVSIGCVHSCYILCCVARSLCISLVACFRVVMSCVNTWLMSFLISCVFVSCFAHGLRIVCWPCARVFVLREHVASVLVFCVLCALMSICLDPTHLVTCLLINFPQLLSLVTLLICSLYNLLVFAVPCGFVAICWVVVCCPALSCFAC